MMKYVTIAMDEELARRIRARGEGRSERIPLSGGSGSREADEPRTRVVERNREMKALERVLSGPMWDVTENGRLPTAEERNARR